MPLFIIIALVALPFSIVLVGLAREYLTLRAEFLSVCDELGRACEDYNGLVAGYSSLFDEHADTLALLDEADASCDRLRKEWLLMLDKVDELTALAECDVTITFSGVSGRGTLRSLSDDMEISLMNRTHNRKANSKYRYKK